MIVTDQRSVDCLANDEKDDKIERTQFTDVLLANESKKRKQDELDYDATKNKLRDAERGYPHGVLRN